MNDIEKNGTSSTLHLQSVPHHSRDPYVPAPTKPLIADPGVLGMFCFATTALVSSLYSVGARGIVSGDLIIGMALFVGGLGQFVAGMWDFPRGELFGASAFAAYGTFWMSYATILFPGSGVIEAYKTRPQDLNNAIGLYLAGWFIVTVLFLIATLRKCIALVITFAGLALTFILLAAGHLTNSTDVGRAAGVVGIFTSFMAYYVGLAVLLSAEERPVFLLPLGML